MSRFHISQDETGYFQLSFEDDAGELTLVSYQCEDADQLVEDASRLAESGEFGAATVVVDPRRHPVAEGIGLEGERPAPRRAGA
jgi:hypothetical protein